MIFGLLVSNSFIDIGHFTYNIFIIWTIDIDRDDYRVTITVFILLYVPQSPSRV